MEGPGRPVGVGFVNELLAGLIVANLLIFPILLPLAFILIRPHRPRFVEASPEEVKVAAQALLDAVRRRRGETIG